MKSLKLVSMAMLSMAMVLVSCSGEDGETGEQGKQGVQGEPGEAGQDGNANVQTLTLDMTEHVGTLFVKTVEELTDEVIANDGILYYLEVQGEGGSRYFSIPGPIFGNLLTQVYTEATTVNVSFMNLDGTGYPITADDELLSLKIIIIESNVGSKTSDASVYNQLKAAGVDTSDYNAVAEYFGL